MSARIGQILEVVEEVRSTCQGAAPAGSIERIRIVAAKSVAARRGITYNAVIDKFIRQLRPDIVSTSRFDVLLKDWLVDGSTELKNIILKHAIDSQDHQLIANAFHRATQQDILLSNEFGFDAADTAFQEGRERLQLHLMKERNRHLIALAKELWLRDGELRCAICSFSFFKAYSEAGEGYIEAHHTTPISEIAENATVRPADLAPVCSNCHGIIHRYRPWLTVDQMRSIVVSNSANYALMQGVAKGEAAVTEQHVLSHAQAKERMARWLK